MGKKYKLGKLGTEFITVIVGEDEKQETFKIHQTLITDRSAFFCNCMRPDWVEAQDGIVKLPMEDPSIFQLYVNSLYAGHFDDVNGKAPNFATLGLVFKMMQMLQDKEGKALVTKELYNMIKNKVTPMAWKPQPDFFDMVTMVWEASEVDAPIRRLLIDTFRCYNMVSYYPLDEKDLFLQGFEKVPAEFLAKVTWNFMVRHRVVEWLADDLESVEEYLDGEKVKRTPTVDNPFKLFKKCRYA